MSNRRKLILALGAGTLVAPFRSHAQQQSKLWRIGVLSALPSGNDQQFEESRQQFRALGYVEGKSITFDYLSSEGNYDRLPALAAELAGRKVDVIFAAGGTPTVLAVKNATRTIPVVFVGVADPVGQGIVASLARPGGNVTGVSSQQTETGVRSLALFKETIPSAKRIVILSNPTNLSLTAVVSNMQAAGKALRLELTIIDVKAPGEFERAFAEIAKNRPAGVVIPIDTMFQNEAGRIIKLAAGAQLPTMGGHSAIPENGGLMSYGANRPDLVRHAVLLVDKILKNAKPGDLPIEQPTKFDLVVNLKAAKTLGINIPNAVMVQATKVIK
jgi:putative ABC transport system substrate-binding protein